MQEFVQIINMGVSLSAIGPAQGLMCGIRLEDGYASVPIELDRRASYAFAREMSDAAQALSVQGGRGPIPIGEREESEFPRLHHLTGSLDLWKGAPGRSERVRALTTREERELASGEFVSHGDRFSLVCVEESLEGKSLCLSKASHGFYQRVSQSRQISLLSPVREQDEVSELEVCGGARNFWSAFLPPDAENGLAHLRGASLVWATALWIASALYVRDAERYFEGFEIKSKDGRRHRLYVDDRERPCLPSGLLSEILEMRPHSIRSVSKVAVQGVPRRAVKIDRSGGLLKVRELRTGISAGEVHPFLAEAGEAAKEAVFTEMMEFHGSDPDLKRAHLEKARLVSQYGIRRLL